MRKIIVTPPTMGIQLSDVKEYTKVIAVNGEGTIGVILYKVVPNQHFYIQWADGTQSNGLKGWKELIAYMDTSTFYQL